MTISRTMSDNYEKWQFNRGSVVALRHNFISYWSNLEYLYLLGQLTNGQSSAPASEIHSTGPLVRRLYLLCALDYCERLAQWVRHVVSYAQVSRSHGRFVMLVEYLIFRLIKITFMYVRVRSLESQSLHLCALVIMGIFGT